MDHQAFLRIARRFSHGDYAMYNLSGYTPGQEADVTYSLDHADVQQLMEDLWDAGVRPMDFGTAGHIAAVQEHLGHVTRILDKVLPVALKGAVK